MAQQQCTHGRRRVALPASIVLNIFFVALIGGHLLLSRTAVGPSENEPLAQALANVEASLSPSEAAAFRRVMRDDAPRYEDPARQLAMARQAVQREITAEPFNADAVSQALTGWQAALNRFFDQFNGPLVDALAKISPDGRRKLVAERRAEYACTSSGP